MNKIKIPKGSIVQEDEKLYYDLLKEIEKDQVKNLDESAKRLIERSAAVLGLFFTIIALSKDFPPPYLLANPATIPLTIILLILVILTQLCGFLSLIPKKYKFFQYNLTENEKEYKKIRERKANLTNWGNAFFLLSMLLLAIVIGIILTAPSP